MRRKKSTAILSFLLAVMLAFGSLPVSAADSPEASGTDEATTLISDVVTIDGTEFESEENEYEGETDPEEDICAEGHQWKEQITRATLEQDGIIERVCINCGETDWDVIDIYHPETIKLSATKYTYDAKIHKPSVKVTDSNGEFCNRFLPFIISIIRRFSA